MITPARRRLLLASSLTVMLAALGGLRLAGATTPPAERTAVVPVEPYRILDTRNGIGVSAPGAVGAGETIDVQISGVGPVPADAVGVVLNLTGTMTTDATYVTAWPAGGTQPTASVLNLTPGIDAPNGVTALLSSDGRLSLFNFSGTTHLVGDVAGYLVASGGGQAGPPGPAGPSGPAGPPGVSGREVTVAFGMVAAGNRFGTADASCPAGTLPVAGGGTTSNEALVLVESAPAGSAWRVTYATATFTPAGANRNFSVHVVCAVFAP